MERLNLNFGAAATRTSEGESAAEITARARIRIGRMQEVTAALSRARTAQEVAEVACRIGSEVMDAHSGAMWVLRDDGSLLLAGAWGTDPNFIEQFRVIPADAEQTPAIMVARSGEPRWIETAADYRAIAPEIFETARAAGQLAAYGAVPLLIQDRPSGVIVFAHPIDHRYDADERAFYVSLATHCSQALDRARLLDAERRTNERLRLLASASEAFSASLDVGETLAALARLAVPAFADWCSVYLVEGEEIRRVAIEHPDAAALETSTRMLEQHPLRLGDGSGLAQVIANGQPLWTPRLTDDELQRGARSEAQLEFMRRQEIVSTIVVPLVSRDRRIGAISFATAHSGRVYDGADLQFAEEIGRRAGLAIANAILFQREQQGRERITQLQQLTSLLANAQTVKDVAEVITRNGVATLGCLTGTLYAVDERLHLLAYHGMPGAFARDLLEVPFQAPLPVARCVREGAPIWIESLEAHAPEFPESARAALRTGMSQALACLPLQVRGRTVGVLVYGYPRPHAFTQEERAFIATLGDHCAQAFERARLLDAAQRAAAAAEEANRIKDEFLATVSHELRTPLNAIIGWSTLLSERADDARAVAKGLEVIRRNAEAQAKIVEDLLDVSRIIGGKLKIDPTPVEMVAVVREAIEVVRPSAEAKRLALTFQADTTPVLLVGDAQRLQQVIWNLLSNAVKFTGEGGRIAVKVERAGSSVAISVADTGKGIAREFMPHLFERFKQADSSTTRRFGGLGLGLAIVRHIVELHGGQVSAASPGPGQGATFRIVLPVRAVAVAPAPVEAPTSVTTVEPPIGQGALLGTRVLVLDDEPDARDLLEAVLVQAGAVVRTAASGREGLELAPEFRPDAVISDIGMPGEDGYAFIQKLRAREGGRSLPAVALTAYARPEDRQRALSAGFDQHVAKPVDPRELTRVIAALLGRSPS